MSLLQAKSKYSSMISLKSSVNFEQNDMTIDDRKELIAEAGLPVFTLNNGLHMPEMFFGIWQKLRDDEVYFLIKEAISAGFRGIDTAFRYCNDGATGKALARMYKEKPNLKRRHLYITGKVWVTYNRNVEECLDQSLKEMGLDYFDLYSIHLPCSLRQNKKKDILPRDGTGKLDFDNEFDYMDVWRQMERLYLSGKIRSVGLANFSLFQLRRIVENCAIKPQVVQIECHPYLIEREIRAYCRKHHIHVQSFSPLYWSLPKEALVESLKAQGVTGISRRNSITFDRATETKYSSGSGKRSNPMFNQHALLRKSFSSQIRRFDSIANISERSENDSNAGDGPMSKSYGSGRARTAGLQMRIGTNLDSIGLPTLSSSESRITRMADSVSRLSTPQNRSRSWSKYHTRCFGHFPFDMFNDAAGDYDPLNPKSKLRKLHHHGHGHGHSHGHGHGGHGHGKNPHLTDSIHSRMGTASTLGPNSSHILHRRSMVSAEDMTKMSQDAIQSRTSFCLQNPLENTEIKKLQDNAVMQDVARMRHSSVEELTLVWANRLDMSVVVNFTDRVDIKNIIAKCLEGGTFKSIKDSYNFTEDDFERLEEIEYQYRYFAFSSYREHDYYPFA